MKRFLAAVVPHIYIITFGMLLVFYVIDNFFNAFMGFMNHPYTRWVIAVFAVSGFISAVMLIAAQRREIRKFNRSVERAGKKTAQE